MGRQVQRQHAGLHPLDVQNLVDQPGEPLATQQCDVHHPAGRGSQRPECAAGDQAERAANGGQRRAQFMAHHGHEFALQPVDLVPLGDVAEHHNGPDRLAVDDEWRRRDLDRNGQAVGAEVTVLLGVGDHLVADRLRDVALVGRVVRAVRRVGVEHLVRVLTDQFVRRIPEHPGGGGIHEGDESSLVDAVDAVADRVDQQVALLGDLTQRPAALDHLLLQDLAEPLVVDHQQDLPGQHAEEHDEPEHRRRGRERAAIQIHQAEYGGHDEQREHGRGAQQR
jgi:hypothetical protein